MHNAVNGTVITLEAGDYRAQLASVGATLVSLTRSGRDLVLSFPATELPTAYKGKILLPWPNRIEAGRYSYAGVDYQLPVNEVETGSAAHGFVTWLNWEVSGQGPTSVTFSLFLPPQRAYPFALRLETTYTLDAEAGLVCRVVAENIGEQTAPYGVAVHPYLTCNQAPLDRCLLLVPASSYLEVDENLIPTGEVSVDGTDYDFRTARTVADTMIDNAFGQLPPEEWNVDLTDPETAMTVRLTSDERWLQIYSADQLGRPGVAVEPMSCPPNAFNTGVDVIELSPGQLSTLSYSIREI